MRRFNDLIKRIVDVNSFSESKVILKNCFFLKMAIATERRGTSMKRETKLRILFLILPCFLVVIFALMYSWGIQPLFNLATVNILCIVSIALELTQAFTQRVNTWKMCGFIGSGAIGGIAAFLNILNDIQEEKSCLGKMSFCIWLWLGLLSTSIIALIVILIRMFRWNQDQWEEVCKWKQEYRKDRMQARRELKFSKQSYKSVILKEKFSTKINKQKDQADKDTVVRNKKYEQLLDRVNNWKKYWGIITDIVLVKAKFLARFAASILMAVLFLIIPYSTKFQTIVISWLDAIKKLADLIKIIPLDDNQNEFFPAFANYIIFYIFLIIAICMIIWLCRYVYKILTRNRKWQEEQDNAEKKPFLEEYDTAIAVLTVFTALVFAFGTSGSPFLDITNKWTTLITVVLFILIVFISIEIVRLIVEQIGQKNSLLKRLVRLIFVTILEFLAGLILGVIINLQIEKVISSLLSIMFPQKELSFTSKIQEKFNEMFNKALDDDKDDGDDYPTPLRFSKKYIWRRYHKK